MRYPIKIGSVGLALVLLLSVIAASAASAAEFEAKPSFPVKFTGEGGVGLLETKAGRSVTCTESSALGEVSEATTVKGVSVKFTGCFAEHFPLLVCGTEGKASGEIVTNKIKGTPVDLNAGKTEAGLLLEPESGTVFAEFVCSLGPIKETIKVTGSVIGQVPNAELKEFRSTLHLEFQALKGAQEWTQVEETGTKHVLMTEGKGTEPFAAEESGISEAVPGETVTTALEGKQIKLVP